jgi:hypothetical protein
VFVGVTVADAVCVGVGVVVGVGLILDVGVLVGVLEGVTVGVGVGHKYTVFCVLEVPLKLLVVTTSKRTIFTY